MDNELKHAGVKGMKWRERKGEEYDPNAPAKIRERELNKKANARREAREAKKGNGDSKRVAEVRKKKINVLIIKK